jgi:hypothetical protein
MFTLAQKPERPQEKYGLKNGAKTDIAMGICPFRESFARMVRKILKIIYGWIIQHLSTF